MDGVEEAAGRNRMVVRNGRLVRTKKTSMKQKRASRKYYLRNKRKIAMRQRKRELKPEFQRTQARNERKKRSLGMVESAGHLGDLVENINAHLYGESDMSEDDMDDLDTVIEDLEEQRELALDLAEEFEGTRFGNLMATLADKIEENLDAIEDGEVDLDEALDMAESGDDILDLAEGLVG